MRSPTLKTALIAVTLACAMPRTVTAQEVREPQGSALPSYARVVAPRDVLGPPAPIRIVGNGLPNIMLTGYWPPTNEMLRQFSNNIDQNPGGWVGENWEGLGYNIYAYFPEFPEGVGKGEGDFEVDYQDTSNDWWLIVPQVKPLALITFSRADFDFDWEMEGGNRTYALNQWTADYLEPFQPTPELPMADEPPGTERRSTLPKQEIVDAVNAQVPNLFAYIEPIDNSRFLSNYIGYHGNWYHDLHSDSADPLYNVAAGHIHVGFAMDLADAVHAAEVTVRVLIGHVDELVGGPEPLLPQNSLGITDCTVDADCTNEAYCVPAPDGSFPGTCYVPKSRYLSIAPNPTNDVPTARRLGVVTFERSCGGAGNTVCTTDTQCAGDPDGDTCDDARTGSQIIGWFSQPDVDGYVGIVDEANRYYAIWTDLTFPVEFCVDELCPLNAYCDVGLGATNTCRWDVDDTEVVSSVVELTGCHISPKRRDARPDAGENKSANFYLIEAIAEGSDIANQSKYSLPLELRTVVVWGDMTGGTQNNVALPPNNAAGFLNILDQVSRFKGKGKATTAWLDLDPQEPDRAVGFLDMLQGVAGFKDAPYPWNDPCTCAGLAPCNGNGPAG